MKQINHKKPFRLKRRDYKLTDIEELSSSSASTIKHTAALAVKQHVKWEEIHGNSPQERNNRVVWSKIGEPYT